MNQNPYIACLFQNHQQRKIITVCLNKNCQLKRLCCLQCIGEFHNDHPKDLVELELFNRFIQQEVDKQIPQSYTNSQTQQIYILHELLDQLESFFKIVKEEIDKVKKQNLQEYLKQSNNQQGIIYQNQQFEGILQYIEVKNYILTLKNQEKLNLKETNLISIAGQAKEGISQIIQYFVKSSSQKILKFSENPIKLEGHQKDVNGVVISTDGTLIASGSMDKTVKLWNGQTKQLLQTFQYTGEIYGGVALSNNNQYLAYGGDGDYSIQLYNLNFNRYLEELIGHKNIILNIVFSQDSKFLFSGGYDKQLIIWEICSSTQFHSLNTDSTIRTIVHSPDEKLISCICDKSVFIWEYPTMKSLRKYDNPHENFGYGLCVSKDSYMLISSGSDGLIIFWYLNYSDNTKIKVADKIIYKVIITSDDQYSISICNQDLKIMIHDIQSGNQIQELKYGIGNGECSGDGYISISHDMNVLVSGGEDGMVKIWRRE